MLTVSGEMLTREMERQMEEGSIHRALFRSRKLCGQEARPALNFHLMEPEQLRKNVLELRIGKIMCCSVRLIEVELATV